MHDLLLRSGWLWVALLVACNHPVDPPVSTFDGGVGGDGVGPCGGPADCPGLDSACRYRTCEAGVCGFAQPAAGAPCEDGGQCDGSGSCTAKLDGSACSSATDCASAHCVQGICCDTACDGSCEACRGEMTDGPSGTCSLVIAGTDPYGHCAPSGTCDGAGECLEGN